MPISTLTEGFEKHYRSWVAAHPGAVAYEKLVRLIEDGDEFGEPVPVLKLARAARTTNNTMRKWLPAYQAQKRARAGQ